MSDSPLPGPSAPVAATGPRSRLSAQERRKAVLDSACRVFFRTSYRGATTAEIAREAGITEPILYRHFGSKRDLYIACLDEAWRIFREFAENALAENPGGCLGAIMDAYTAKRAKLRLVDLWIQALTEASEDALIAKAVRQQILEVHAFLADVIRRGQADGVLHADRDPAAEAWIFVAAGLLATIDQRLGGLLGGDLERVRASRRAWMAC
jgi:AcrR family transcriptional regulator